MDEHACNDCVNGASCRRRKCHALQHSSKERNGVCQEINTSQPVNKEGLLLRKSTEEVVIIPLEKTKETAAKQAIAEEKTSGRKFRCWSVTW